MLWCPVGVLEGTLRSTNHINVRIPNVALLLLDDDLELLLDSLVLREALPFYDERHFLRLYG